MSGAICGARNTRRKYWSVSRSLATMVTVCSSIGKRLAVLLRGGAFRNLLVSGEREQRPGVAIDVVFQIKNFRKTGAGRLGFRPRTVRILSLHEIFNAAFERGIFGIIERAQAHDGPRGLGRGAWALTFENGVVVSVASLTPAGVGMLNAFEPDAGALQPRLIHVEVQRAHSTQNLPRSINVIHAPAAIPRAVFLLLRLDVFERVPDLITVSYTHLRAHETGRNLV